MPEIRQNLATKEWVIIATERARRPEDFKTRRTENKLPARSDTCPFCPGNEVNAPGETCVISDENGWKAKSVPNKYPALQADGDRTRTIKGIKRYMTGVGIHEVIIETPVHNTTTALMKDRDVEDIIRIYRERYIALSEDERIELVTIFKNHGESAGTSLEHPHSQIVGTPVVPQHIRLRIEEAMRYFDDNGECVFCRMMKEELREKERIILETDCFVSFILYAAASPFHTWILPKRHTASFGKISDREVADLAKILRTTLAKMYYGLENPDFNYVIRSSPCDIGESDSFHWYLSIMPRITKTAGFELGSGMYINTSFPEESAKFLRGVKI